MNSGARTLRARAATDMASVPATDRDAQDHEMDLTVSDATVDDLDFVTWNVVLLA